MNRLPRLTLFSCLLLAACGDPEPANDAANLSALNAAMEANATVDANMSVPAPANAAEAAPVVNLAPDGLALVLPEGATRPAKFELAQAATLTMVSAALGKPTDQGTNEECGEGPLAFASFPRGLTLYFQEGKFAGWDVDGREGGKFTTAAGIGIGSTRKQLAAAGPVTVEDSSLGTEFAAGEMSGLLSSRAPTGTITNLWAGSTCIAR